MAIVVDPYARDKFKTISAPWDTRFKTFKFYGGDFQNTIIAEFDTDKDEVTFVSFRSEPRIITKVQTGYFSFWARDQRRKLVEKGIISGKSRKFLLDFEESVFIYDLDEHMFLDWWTDYPPIGRVSTYLAESTSFTKEGELLLELSTFVGTSSLVTLAFIQTRVRKELMKPNKITREGGCLVMSLFMEKHGLDFPTGMTYIPHWPDYLAPAKASSRIPEKYKHRLAEIFAVEEPKALEGEVNVH